MAETQNYQNHARLDPPFHFFTSPLLLACFIASVVFLWHHHSAANVLLVLLSLGALMTAFLTRIYALKVQDRVIRLEESLRLKSLGISADGLTIRQFVALRFASDHELEALVARAKAENLSGKQIKQAIQDWRPDNHRV